MGDQPPAAPDGTQRRPARPGSGASRARVLASPWVRLAILVVVLGGALAWLVTYGDLSEAGIRGLVTRAGPAAPAAYVALYATLVVLLVPGAVLTAAGGVLFGTALGTVLAVTGAGIGAVGAFVVGRLLGRDGVRRLAGDRMERLDGWLARRGFLAVLYLRLIPLVPFNVLNYVASVTEVPRRDYALATVLGIVPGTFAYVVLGRGLFEVLVGRRTEALTRPSFLFAVGLLVVLAVGGPLLDRALRRRGADLPPADEPTG